MTEALLEEVAAAPELMVRYTIGDYEHLMRSGIIDEGAPIELLDGQLYLKIRSASGEAWMAIGDDHSMSVLKIGRLDRELDPQGCHMRTQQPIALPPYDVPEPDGAIAKGALEGYAGRKPTAADLLCVIEVADASLRRDQGYKLELYAKFGIPLYLIVNLVDRAIEVYSAPVTNEGRYQQKQIVLPGQTLALPTGTGVPLVVAADRLLP